MAVAPAWMADEIIVLDEGDVDEGPRPSCSTSKSESAPRPVSRLDAQQPIIVHVPPSPFATAKPQSHVLEAENQKLFSEFVEHCSALTQDCPEVLTFLQTKHAKASPDFLKSVEFRNTIGRCLTRAQNNRSKTFVFINELCTVLKQHCAKKRQNLTKVEAKSSVSISSLAPLNSAPLKHKDKTKGSVKENGTAATEDQQPSTSEPQVEERVDRKVARASKKQIAYLENLLKVYHEEICRLQKTDLSLEDMEAEDSLYIQEHKLKRKMMKIYEKLCELKDCSTLTGRAIEQRIPYNSTRYPEINRKIQRYISSQEVRWNPPDYQDILQLVLRVNERRTLGLNRKQLNQIALDAFRETGSLLQERRHLDMVYNFGSQLTDLYKPASDPALLDSSLQRRLRANREVALSRLEEVISKYAIKQEDREEQDRSKRQAKEDNEQKEGEEKEAVNGVQGEEHPEEEDEEEEEEEDEESSDPDIEEEIRASTQQDGPDEDEVDKEQSTEEEQAGDQDHAVSQTHGPMNSQEDQVEEVMVRSGLCPLSTDIKSQESDLPSPRNSLSPSESSPVHEHQPPLRPEKPTDFHHHAPSPDDEPVVVTSVTANGTSTTRTLKESGTDMTNGVSSDVHRVTRSVKRKRTGEESKDIVLTDSETDHLLDICSTPPPAPPPQAHTLVQDKVIRLQSTPPPKRNKVNVATQCDPDEVIVLSDSD